MLYAGYAAIVIVATFSILFGIKMLKGDAVNFKKIYKIFALITAVFFFVRYMLGRNAIESIVGLTDASAFSVSISNFFIWFNILCVLAFCLNAFFEVQTAKNVLTFFVLPVSAINLIIYFINVPAIVGQAQMQVFDLRALLYAIESALVFAGSLIVVIKQNHFKLSKAEVKNLILSIIFMLIVTMPSYTLQVFFGAGKYIEFLDINPQHRILIYLGLIAPAILYFVFRSKSEDTKRYMLIFLALGTMITFTIRFLFSCLPNPADWPLHLCNTAMYIIPLCLCFRLRKLFYFTYFINVLGAFLAIIMPNYTAGGIFSPDIYIFWVNHWPAFFMPFLIVALGVFPRPRWKEFKYSMIYFAIYFVFILIINAWFSNYGTVDFFFLNSDFVVSKLGKWAEDLRNVKLQFMIGNLSFTFYPLYQFLFYLVYTISGFAMWFLYENFYGIAQKHHELMTRKKKINLDMLALKSQLGGRSIREPVNKKGLNMVNIKNFSKRYGSSKTFAVENANLEIHAGEIFGFLGPNGAGKSTIIKSLVGIQPITSGSIEICGYDVEKQSVEAKMNTGFVPDHYALYEKLTGREYINYIADLYQVSKEDRDKRISRFLEVFELVQAFDNQMKTYSHGMKQKIAIIAALIHNPKVWILDEPLTGLDPNSIYQVKEIMKQHARAGNIVFFSSHIIDVVERICDCIAIIKKGKILCVQNVKDLEKDKVHLEDFYLETIGEKLEQYHE
ncbi:MAG: ATP-binding cassette domain-containing protein [Clostridia bacterium]